MNPAGDPEQLMEGKKFRVERLRLRGAGGQVLERDVVRHPGAVCVLPILDGDPSRVVLIRNHRFAVGTDLWELPAGTLEPGEPAETTAARELIEETGYRAERLREIARFYTSPGITDERMTVFIATGLTHVGQRLEAGEEIKVETVPATEALALIDTGDLADAKSIAVLLMADRLGLLEPAR